MKHRRRAIAATILLLLAMAPSATALGRAPEGGWAPTIPAPRHPKLAPDVAAGLTERMGAASAEGSTTPPAAADAVVQVNGRDSEDLQRAVAESDGVVRTVSDGSVLARVPPARLTALSEDPRVDSVTTPRRMRSVATSQGVAQSGASGWHSRGLDGAGVKVGVVDVGFAQLTTEQAFGRLPLTVITKSFCDQGIEGSTNHGTAVAEIVHQMAPSAQLYLVCVEFDADVASAEQYLAQNGVTIVNASITSNLSGRGDGSGPVGAAVAAGRAAGQFWAAAAGNDGNRHFNFVGTDNDGDGAVEFVPGGPLNPAAPDSQELYSLSTNGNVAVDLKYDAWPTTTQEFAICVWAASSPPPGPELGCNSGGQQGGARPPVTSIVVPAGNHVLAIFRVGSTSIAPRFDLYFQGPVTGLQRVTASGSIGEPASSPSAVAVGAYNVNTLGLEVFSSQGPTIDGRVKPDIAGPDGVSNDVIPGFTGTSASTPHIAGAAALLKQSDPNLTAALLQLALQGEAIDAGQTGRDNQFGAGRLTLQPRTFGGPGAVTTVGGQVLLFVRGTDGGLWERLANGTWQRLGGYLTTDPDVSSMSPNRVDVFARGGDNALWHLQSNDGGATWQPWQSLGGIITTGPGVVSWGPNRIDVFARGTDNALWHRAFAGAWGSWHSLGGGLTADPAVSSWGANRLDIFIRGLDGALWKIAWTGSAWSPWQGLGGALGSGPAAESASFNTIDVFARGTDGQLWARAWNGSVWANWFPLGGGTSADPAASVYSSGTKLDLVISGLDGAVWRRTRTSGQWGAWSSLGPPMLN